MESSCSLFSIWDSGKGILIYSFLDLGLLLFSWSEGSTQKDICFLVNVHAHISLIDRRWLWDELSMARRFFGVSFVTLTQFSI